MLTILLIVIVLVAWSLHLMQEAVEQREFSLMLAGFLVAVAAAAMVAVYFLMGHYVGYMSKMARDPYSWHESCESLTWVVPADPLQEGWADRVTKHGL